MLEELSQAVRLMPADVEQSVLRQIECLTATVNQRIHAQQSLLNNDCGEGEMEDAATVPGVDESEVIECDDIRVEETETELAEECLPLEETVSVKIKESGVSQYIHIVPETKAEKQSEAGALDEGASNEGEVMDCDNTSGHPEKATQNDSTDTQFVGERGPDASAEIEVSPRRKAKPRCLVCRRKFASPQQVRQHMQSAHNMVLDVKEGRPQTQEPCVCPDQLPHAELVEGREYKCEICNKVLRAEIGLKQHMAKYHTNILPTQCDICHRQYDHYKKLMAHKRQCHNNRDFVCPKCAYTTKHSMDLKRHLLRKHGNYEDYPYVCEHCGKRFIMPNSHKKHLLVHQGVERPLLVCEYEGCEFSTISHSSMFLHVRKQHKGITKSWECDVCGVRLGTNQTYKIHMRRHNGENPYICRVCGVGFPCNAQLTAHHKIHGEKSEACTVCGKKFLDKAKVKRHMAVHSDEKKYKCPWCPYKCNLDSNLRKHCQAKHNHTYPPKTRNQISAKPRNVAPFRFKRESSTNFARSIVMALSKADPAQLASIAGGEGGVPGPLLYLDTANNQIILRTENSDPALEAHPKFTLREENGQYHLVQVPSSQDVPGSNPMDALQSGLAPGRELQVESGGKAEELIETSLAQALLGATGAVVTGGDNSQAVAYLQEEQAGGGVCMPTQYVNAGLLTGHLTPTIKPGLQDAANGNEVAAFRGGEVAAFRGGEVAAFRGGEVAAFRGGEVAAFRGVSGSGKELVITEDTLHQLSAVSEGGMVLIEQPDGSTFELQVQGNQINLKQVTKREDASVKQEEIIEECGDMNITDPSQYITAYDSSALKGLQAAEANQLGASDTLMPTSSIPDFKPANNQQLNVNEILIQNSMATSEGLLSVGNDVRTDPATAMTVVGHAGTLSVVYASGEHAVMEGAREEEEENLFIQEIQVQQSHMPINPQDFVNTV